MTRIASVILLFVTACADAGEDITDSLLAEYSAGIEDVRATTTSYKGAVDAATDMDGVAAAQTTYLQGADVALEDLGHVLTGMHDCEMMGDAQARVTLANATVTAMHEAVDGLEAAHVSHTEVSECTSLAGEHEVEMAGHFTDLAGHQAAWSTTMTCMSHGEGGEEEPADDHGDGG